MRKKPVNRFGPRYQEADLHAVLIGGVWLVILLACFAIAMFIG